MVEIPMTFYHDPSEQLRGVLGQNYITTIISEKRVERSLMILTDKRLYQTGKIYERGVGGNFISTAGKKTVAVRDITGTTFREENAVLWLIYGIFTVLGSFFCFLAAAKSSYRDQTIVFIIALSVLGVGVGSILIYFIKRRRWFIIEYAGGAVATLCKWYSTDEVEEFQKKISLEKDRIAKEMQREK
jgi:hypothetical protein